MPFGGPGASALPPGARGPSRATQFALPHGPFADGVFTIGAVALAVTSLVLIEGEVDARRTDHNRALFFGRTVPAAATGGAPWYLWQKVPRLLDAEEEVPRPNHTLLHRYRQAFQTVGQPTFLLCSRSPQVEVPEAYDVKTARPDLHLYRTGFQTVGQQKFPLYVRQVQPELPEAYDVKAAPPDLHRYRTGFQTVGQSYRTWPKAAPRVEEEAFEVRTPTSFLPFIQTPVAITGMPRYYIIAAAPIVWDDDYDSRGKPWLLNAFRGQVTATPVGAPWYLWKLPAVQIDPEEDARRADHTLLHRYRTGFQTVGQSWQYWLRPPTRVDEEAYVVPGPSSLLPFRQTAIITPHGFPLWYWPRAVADQDVEPNPIYKDGGALLYPFRPHQAVVPPVVTYRIFIINE